MSLIFATTAWHFPQHIDNVRFWIVIAVYAHLEVYDRTELALGLDTVVLASLSVKDSYSCVKNWFEYSSGCMINVKYEHSINGQIKWWKAAALCWLAIY